MIKVEGNLLRHAALRVEPMKPRKLNSHLYSKCPRHAQKNQSFSNTMKLVYNDKSLISNVILNNKTKL